MSDGNFDWPCSKRRAHGPHLKECHNHVGGVSNYVRGKQCPNCVVCPGVKAHPATMIGGAFKRETPGGS
jgi:hypothetical protein